MADWLEEMSAKEDATARELEAIKFKVLPTAKERRAYSRANGEAFSYRPVIADIVTRAGWRRALGWFRFGLTRRCRA